MGIGLVIAKKEESNMVPEDTSLKSVSFWIGNLRHGDQQAAEDLWARYASRLIEVARKKLDLDIRKAVSRTKKMWLNWRSQAYAAVLRQDDSTTYETEMSCGGCCWQSRIEKRSI